MKKKKLSKTEVALALEEQLNRSFNVSSGNATVVYDHTRGVWVIPGGKQIHTRVQAMKMAKILDYEIERVLNGTTDIKVHYVR